MLRITFVLQCFTSLHEKETLHNNDIQFVFFPYVVLHIFHRFLKRSYKLSCKKKVKRELYYFLLGELRERDFSYYCSIPSYVNLGSSDLGDTKV